MMLKSTLLFVFLCIDPSISTVPCEDDCTKELYCSILRAYLNIGVNKCSQEIQDARFLGNRDCRRTCGLCSDNENGEDFYRHNNVAQAEAGDVLQRMMHALKRSKKERRAQANGEKERMFLPVFRSSNGVTLLPEDNDGHPTPLSSDDSSTECMDDPAYDEFCGKLSRLIIRGKNRCNRVYDPGDLNLVGVTLCPQTCGVCDGYHNAIIAEERGDSEETMATAFPSFNPSTTPRSSFSPSNVPTALSSRIPSLQPTKLPSYQPTTLPSNGPTFASSHVPSFVPTFISSAGPSVTRNFLPSDKPVSSPSFQPSSTPPVFPSSKPSVAPSLTYPVTYVPGELSTSENGLVLSTGLRSKIIATSGERVNLVNGGTSEKKFHQKPDGAAIFPTDDDGWVYVSNSEVSPEDEGFKGGVGSLRFNNKGEVIDYYRILRDTRKNCGGGKTPWNTWLSCEEVEGGAVYETDPYGKFPANITRVGGTGGKYESVAYDDRYFPTIHFYLTEDTTDGATRRFTPDPDIVEAAYAANDFSPILTSAGTTEYLVVELHSSSHGIFYWSTNEAEGRDSANDHYSNAEGIDVRDGMLYFVSKVNKELFILDLDKGTYQSSTTKSGAFEGQPDQIARMVNDESDIVYFCEDSFSVAAGVHGRNSAGRFFTILEGPDYDTESTGLAFSPDNMHMYVSFQKRPGHIFDIYREDGYPFNGQTLDIKYHAQEQQR